MTQITLHESAKAVVDDIIQLGLPDSTAIIITNDGKSDGMTGRFIEKTIAESLKTRKIGTILNDIPIYVFGLDEFPPEARLELRFSPTRGKKLQKDGRLSPKDRANLSYFFEVTITLPQALEGRTSPMMSKVC